MKNPPKRYDDALIDKIRREYVENPTPIGLRKLGKKHGVDWTYLGTQSKNRGWRKQRREFQKQRYTVEAEKALEAREGARSHLAEDMLVLLETSIPEHVEKAKAGNPPSLRDLAALGNLYARLKDDVATSETPHITVINRPATNIPVHEDAQDAPVTQPESLGLEAKAEPKRKLVIPTPPWRRKQQQPLTLRDVNDSDTAKTYFVQQVKAGRDRAAVRGEIQATCRLQWFLSDEGEVAWTELN